MVLGKLDAKKLAVILLFKDSIIDLIITLEFTINNLLQLLEIIVNKVSKYIIYIYLLEEIDSSDIAVFYISKSTAAYRDRNRINIYLSLLSILFSNLIARYKYKGHNILFYYKYAHENDLQPSFKVLSRGPRGDKVN